MLSLDESNTFGSDLMPPFLRPWARPSPNMSRSENMEELPILYLTQFPLFLLRGHTTLLRVCLTSSYIPLSLPLPRELISGEMKRVRLAPGCSRESLVEPEDQTLL